MNQFPIWGIRSRARPQVAASLAGAIRRLVKLGLKVKK
jgi:hypothetical protein